MTVITASAAGGAWNTNGAWVGGVQPTAADDVLLTAASGNISLSAATTVVCRSLDCTGYTGTLTWGSATARLNIGGASGGNCTFVAGMTITLTGQGTLGFNSTTASTTYTLTSAGKVLPTTVVANGASTTLQLADNTTFATAGSGITLTSGILDTNGKTVIAPSFNPSNANVRTLTLGSSALTFSAAGVAFNASTFTNLTVTANTATVTLSGASANFLGGVNWNGLSLVFSGTGISAITGVNTFANLTATGPAAIDGALALSANQTVTGTLTLTGNAAANRLWVLSSVPGTPRTITCNGTVTASRVDFEDIVGAGSASWNLAGITGGSGDCGGCSGITFTTAATKYAVLTQSWSINAAWSLTSGGVGGAPHPLPQDDVVLDAASGAITITMNMQRHCRNLTCTGFVGTLTLATSAIPRYIFGSLTLSSGMTFTATGNFTFAGRGSHTIDMAGKAFTGASLRNITVGRFGGTYTLAGHADFGSNATTVAGQLQVSGGVTFTAAGFNVTAQRVDAGSGGAATLNLGSGTWSLTGTGAGNAWLWYTPGATINAGTSNIVIATPSATLRNFQGGGYDLTYTVAGSTGGLDILGATTFHDLNFSDVTNARTLRFSAGATYTFTGAYNVFGTAGKLMTVGSITAANHTLTKTSGTVASDYLSISRSQATGGAAWYAGANSTDGGNNTGWQFIAAPSGENSNFFAMF